MAITSDIGETSNLAAILGIKLLKEKKKRVNKINLTLYKTLIFTSQ